MDNFYNITVCIINAFCLSTAMSNLILYPIKYLNKFIIFIYIFIFQMFLFPIYGQSLTLLCVGGVVLIIAISNNHFISNITFSLFGYLLYVLLNHIMIVPLYLFGITIEKLCANYIADTIFTLSFGIIVFCVTFFLGKYLRRLFPDYNKSFLKSIRILFFIEIFSCSIVYIYNIIEGEKFGYPSQIIYFNGLLFSFFFIVTITIFLVCLRIMKRNNELTQKQKEEDDLMDYMMQLENMFQQTRVFKHDYMNILSTLSHYIEEGDSENLKVYFQTQVLPDCYNLTDKDALIAQLGNIKIKELKGLLYSKMVTALNRNLPVHLEIRNEIEFVAIKTLDLCKVVGIFIDNAMDEASESSEKSLNIAFIKDEEHLSVVIENSTDKTNINLQEIYMKDITHKRGHSGLGLYIAKNILNSYGNITHSTTLRNGIFTQIIDIS